MSAAKGGHSGGSSGKTQVRGAVNRNIHVSRMSANVAGKMELWLILDICVIKIELKGIKY